MNKDLKHCESCKKWHTDEDMCFSKLKEHNIFIEAELAGITNALLAGDLIIRELVSRQYNTNKEQLFFRELHRLLLEARDR